MVRASRWKIWENYSEVQFCQLFVSAPLVPYCDFPESSKLCETPLLVNYCSKWKRLSPINEKQVWLCGWVTKGWLGYLDAELDYFEIPQFFFRDSSDLQGNLCACLSHINGTRSLRKTLSVWVLSKQTWPILVSSLIKSRKSSFSLSHRGACGGSICAKPICCREIF